MHQWTSESWIIFTLLILFFFAFIAAVVWIHFKNEEARRISEAILEKQRFRTKLMEDEVQRIIARGGTNKDVNRIRRHWLDADKGIHYFENMLTLDQRVIIYEVPAPTVDEAQKLFPSIDAKIKELLKSTPGIDLLKYEKFIGAEIIRIDKYKDPSDRKSIDI